MAALSPQASRFGFWSSLHTALVTVHCRVHLRSLQVAIRRRHNAGVAIQCRHAAEVAIQRRPPGIGVAIRSRVTNPPDAPQLCPPVLRLTQPSAATLTARCTPSNSTQGKLPTSRNLLAGLAQIARVRFPRPPHSIPRSALPRIPIRHVWNLATGRCLLAVPFLEACELPRSRRGSALGSETTCWRGSGSVVVRRLLRLWWANNCPLVSGPRLIARRARVHSPWGWDSRAMAQSSRRRPARVHVRAVTRYTIGGCSAREPVVRAAALHQLAGHQVYRYSNVPYLTVFPHTVFRTTIYPKISESRPLRGREGLGTYTRTLNTQYRTLFLNWPI